MECRFEGAFTEEEKRRIRSSLEALGEVARARGIEGESGWRIEQHVEDGADEGDVELRAVHEESGIELWGQSADDLARTIDKTADFLRRNQ